jgi:hypothetical protein
MSTRILASAIVMLLAAAPALGQSKTGTTLGQFLLIEPSARGTSMGNAGVSLFGGLDAVYYNAAAAARLDGREALFSHSAWLAGITYDYVAAALPMGKWGSAFATVTSLNSGEIEVRTVSQPLGTGERYRVSDVALGLGYGREITDRFAAGFQITYMQETIWHSSAGAFLMNLGTLYRVSDNGLHIGASLANYGIQSRFGGRDLRISYDADPGRNGDNGSLPGDAYTDPFSMPVLFRVGVGMPFRTGRDGRLRLAVDATHPSDDPESMDLGAEWTLKRALALRFGYQDLFLKDAETGLTAGAGLQGKMDVYKYHLDYAWAGYGRLGSTQRFTVGVAF